MLRCYVSVEQSKVDEGDGEEANGVDDGFLAADPNGRHGNSENAKQHPLEGDCARLVPDVTLSFFVVEGMVEVADPS